MATYTLGNICKSTPLDLQRKKDNSCHGKAVMTLHCTILNEVDYIDTKVKDLSRAKLFLLIKKLRVAIWQFLILTCMVDRCQLSWIYWV